MHWAAYAKRSAWLLGSIVAFCGMHSLPDGVSHYLIYDGSSGALVAGNTMLRFCCRIEDLF